jgi:hypothetical protein
MAGDHSRRLKVGNILNAEKTITSHLSRGLSAVILIKESIMLSGSWPDCSILFGVFLFLFFLTLFLQAFRRLFLLAFLGNESFCHGFNILIYNKLILRYHFRF